MTFICQDGNQRERFLAAADYELTDHLWLRISALGNLELQVEKLLKQDDELLKELARSWDEATRANVVTNETYQAIGTRSVAVRTAYGSINTGDQTRTPTYSDQSRDDAERPG